MHYTNKNLLLKTVYVHLYKYRKYKFNLEKHYSALIGMNENFFKPKFCTCILYV